MNAAITAEQKLLAVLAHISYFLGGLGFIIAPLLIFLLRRNDAFVYEHARQALVAHLTVLVLSAGVFLLSFLLIGLLLLPLLAVVWLALLVTSIIASIRAADGDEYRYPFLQGLVRRIQ